MSHVLPPNNRDCHLFLQSLYGAYFSGRIFLAKPILFRKKLVVNDLIFISGDVLSWFEKYFLE